MAIFLSLITLVCFLLWFFNLIKVKKLGLKQSTPMRLLGWLSLALLLFLTFLSPLLLPNFFNLLH